MTERYMDKHEFANFIHAEIGEVYFRHMTPEDLAIEYKAYCEGRTRMETIGSASQIGYMRWLERDYKTRWIGTKAW